MIVGISGYVGNRLTGIGRVLINVLSELAKLYPEDKYVLFRNFDFKEYDCLAKYQNIEIVDVPYTKESGLKNILWHQWLFQKLLKEYKCDIAYIPNFTLLLWKAVPTIVTIHDLIEYNVPDKFSKTRMIYRKWICDPLMARRSDGILTVSESSRNDIVKYLHQKPSRVKVTPNAVDHGVFRKYDKAEVLPALSKYELEYNGYLLFVGTIDYPGKNIKTAIDAFFGMKSQGTIDKKLVIVGKDGYNSQVIYDAVNASPYRNDVIFTGYLPDEDLPKLYAGAYLVLYLSLYEGFGLPVLEAMACGTPVICSNTSCFPEVVGELDVCVPPTDVRMVETKIQEMTLNESYRKMLAEKCYKKAQEYSWETSARLYHQAFLQVNTKS